MIPDQDWIVDGRRVGHIKDGLAWLDDASDFATVKGLPLPGDTIRHELKLGRVAGSKGAFVFRGLPLQISRTADRGSLHDGYLDIPFKGGHNDLSRWKRFGGKLERPAPPAPMNINSNSARTVSTDS